MATQRGYYRSELLRSIDNIEMTLTHLVRVKLAYEEAHPEVSQVVEGVCNGLVLIAETIQKLHDEI